MGTLVDNNEEKRELDDSGCVQDDSPKKMAEGVENSVNLLDLSDDVLLYILRHCSPRDLKALGYSCARLGRLVRERSLWRRVDARSEPCSLARLKWYITHALHADTRHLYIRGYAGESRGCLGLLSGSRKEAEDEEKSHQAQKNNGQEMKPGLPLRMHNIQRHHACFYISAHSSSRLRRFRGSPLWSDEEGWGRVGGDPCGGPQFSVSEPLLRQLRVRCARLTRLALERCNIDCNTTNLGHLPPTLTRLSLCGTKCYNLPIDKSFLFKIQDHLPLLESLDVSECDWLEPASLLPLSKHSKLKELYMRDCHRMSEFVAYASLSSRYGFRQLQILDLRGSPVGDSEVAPLAWLPELRQLKLSATMKPAAAKHAHYADDKRVRRPQLDDWEMQVPDYFQDQIQDPDARMNFDGDGSTSTSGDDGSSDDDDSDADDMDDNAGRVVQPDHNEMVPDEGESSKTGRDTTKTKRKAENGSGDASVNGESSSKRKKNDPKDRKRPNTSDSGDSEDMYKKRRCQTIVIVNRHSYNGSDDDDEPHLIKMVNSGPYVREDQHRGVCYPSTSGTSKSANNSKPEDGKRGDKEESKDVDESETVDEEMGNKQSDNSEGIEDSKPNADENVNVAHVSESIEDCKPKADENVNVGASTSNNIVANEGVNTNSDSEIVKSNNTVNEIASASKDAMVSNDGASTSRYSTLYNNGASTSRNDEPNVGASASRNDVPNVEASTSKVTSIPDQGNTVNEGASTSKVKDKNDNETASTSRDNATNNNSERYVCFRQGQQPVVVNMSNDRPEVRGPSAPSGSAHRMLARNFQDVENLNIHHYNIHQHILNQRYGNLEIRGRVGRDGNMPERPDLPQRNERPAEPQNRRSPEEANNVDRRSLVDRNPRIMNLIRNAERNNAPYPMFPPHLNQNNMPFLQDIANNYSPVRNADNANLPTQEDNREREPRHRVLYVNVGQHANAVGPLPNMIQGLAAEGDNRIFNHIRSHIEPASLLTDAAIRRFGRATSNEVRFFVVGIPHPFLGPNNDGNTRPERSNLEVLIVSGYRTITDRSLVHLATAAPYLRFLDCRETNVTAQGVENFRSLRPDCEVLFSPYVERDKLWQEEND